MTNKMSAIFALGILIMISVACSFSTANLSDLKFGKDKNASGAGTSFNANDEIFAVTAVNNASGKNKVKFRVLFDKVEGATAGAVAYKIETDMPVEDSRAVWFNFSLPGGFANGSYKVEAVLTDESGKELDRKTGTYTITGGSTAKPPTADKPASETAKPDADKDKDSEDN